MNPIGLQELKVVALAVDDIARAEHFYGHTLGLAPAIEAGVPVGFALGSLVVMLKVSGDEWPARPAADLNPRLTFVVGNAHETERLLAARGVRISDSVQPYDGGKFHVGAFLDSEGNRLWFCSDSAAT